MPDEPRDGIRVISDYMESSTKLDILKAQVEAESARSEALRRDVCRLFREPARPIVYAEHVLLPRLDASGGKVTGFSVHLFDFSSELELFVVPVEAGPVVLANASINVAGSDGTITHRHYFRSLGTNDFPLSTGNPAEARRWASEAEVEAWLKEQASHVRERIRYVGFKPHRLNGEARPAEANGHAPDLVAIDAGDPEEPLW